jgi:hypothetical protein
VWLQLGLLLGLLQLLRLVWLLVLIPAPGAASAG